MRRGMILFAYCCFSFLHRSLHSVLFNKRVFCTSKHYYQRPHYSFDQAKPLKVTMSSGKNAHKLARLFFIAAVEIKHANISGITRLCHFLFRTIKTTITYVKYWFGQLDVSKMAGALCHVSGACLASTCAIDGALPRIHQTVQLRTTSFHRLGVLYATCQE